ncbi:MAG: hypothetical protein AAGE61_13325, partial [Pseudomonadota bacterium]
MNVIESGYLSGMDLNGTLLVIGNRPVTLAEGIIGACLLVGLIGVLFVVRSARSNAARRIREEEQLRRAAELDQRLREVAAQQAEMTGRMQTFADVFGSRQQDLTRVLGERMDSMTHRLGQNLAET